MSVDLVSFNIRYEKSLHVLKIQPPKEVSELVQQLKTELQVESTDELIILCPTSEGKMMEIKSDDDIEFLKKNKLCYNAVSKEIYCSVELVVVIISKQLPDDPKVQMMMLSNKVNQLSSQIDELSQSLFNKIEDNTSSILESIRSMKLEQTASDNKPKEDSFDQLNDSNLKPKRIRHKVKNTKEKESLSSSSSASSATNENLSNSTEDIDMSKNAKCSNKIIDDLLEKLCNEGFKNPIQNIIVLKRFDNDYEKAINYLKNTMS